VLSLLEPSISQTWLSRNAQRLVRRKRIERFSSLLAATTAVFPSRTSSARQRVLSFSNRIR
jgi:hypothetical protein